MALQLMENPALADLAAAGSMVQKMPAAPQQVEQLHILIVLFHTNSLLLIYRYLYIKPLFPKSQ
jgi:hypothetical protein